jgi:omega-amidase
MTNIKVNIVQSTVRSGGPAANLERMNNIITNRVPSLGVIVLPELWTCAYDVENLEKYASYYEQTLSFLSEIAKKKASWIIGGSIPAMDNGKLFNRTPVIDDSGNMAGTYDKCHLFPGLDRKFSAGKKPFIFDISGTRCACILCYDLRFPEYTRALALSGVNILFVLSAWSSLRIEHWRIMLQSRAIENEIFVIGANQSGTSGKHSYGGNSMIVSPMGQILGKAGDKMEILKMDIDPGEVPRARRILPVFDSRNRSLYRPVTIL